MYDVNTGSLVSQFLCSSIIYCFLCRRNYDFECWMLTMKQLRTREAATVAILYWHHHYTMRSLPSCTVLYPNRGELPCFFRPQMRGGKLDRIFSFIFIQEQRENLIIRQANKKNSVTYTLKMRIYPEHWNICFQRYLKPTTWQNCGTCHASLYVRTMDMEWAHLWSERQLPLNTTPEEISSLASK